MPYSLLDRKDMRARILLSCFTALGLIFLDRFDWKKNFYEKDYNPFLRTKTELDLSSVKGQD